ncbi:MAG TPA: GMP synthase [Saprospiraceae bacterium]|nr:GMP synthase [Saprospiraceae bacterium]HQW56829.1 GMP synthase [Saprospiraceae bacterium]
MKKARLAILDMNNNTPNLGLASIVQHVEACSEYFDYEIFDVRGKNQIPGLEFDAYISSGGPGDPREEDGVWDVNFYAWLRSIMDFNTAHSDQKKHVFLICHSFQMGVLFFQTGFLRKRFHISFGIFPCYLTGNGIHEKLFDGLPNPIYCADFRNYEVVWPHFESKSDVYPKVLAVEQLDVTKDRERAIMAIRFTPEIIGTQFHPEAYAEGMYQYFNQEERSLQVTSEHGEAKLNQMIRDLKHPKKIALTNQIILPNFLHQCIDEYYNQKEGIKVSA